MNENVTMDQGCKVLRPIVLKTFDQNAVCHVSYCYILDGSVPLYEPDYGPRARASDDSKSACVSALEPLLSSHASFTQQQCDILYETVSCIFADWSSLTHSWNEYRMIWNDECPRNDHYIIVSTECRFFHLTKLLLIHRGQPRENWQNAYGKFGIGPSITKITLRRGDGGLERDWPLPGTTRGRKWRIKMTGFSL